MLETLSAVVTAMLRARCTCRIGGTIAGKSSRQAFAMAALYVAGPGSKDLCKCEHRNSTDIGTAALCSVLMLSCNAAANEMIVGVSGLPSTSAGRQKRSLIAFVLLEAEVLEQEDRRQVVTWLMDIAP